MPGQTGMRNLLIPFFAIAALCSCASNSDSGSGDPVGFSGIVGSNNTALSEIVFTLDLVYEDSLYLLTDSLFSLELYLNNREWGSFTSTTIDTTGFESVKDQGNLMTNDPVQYLFVTNDQSGKDSLNTAGDYSIALRKLLSIQPGDYVAEIRYVSWINNDGELVKRPVRDLIPFTLTADMRSLYIGNFTSNIKL